MVFAIGYFKLKKRGWGKDLPHHKGLKIMLIGRKRSNDQRGLFTR